MRWMAVMLGSLFVGCASAQEGEIEAAAISEAWRGLHSLHKAVVEETAGATGVALSDVESMIRGVSLGEPCDASVLEAAISALRERVFLDRAEEVAESYRAGRALFGDDAAWLGQPFGPMDGLALLCLHGNAPECDRALGAYETLAYAMSRVGRWNRGITAREIVVLHRVGERVRNGVSLRPATIEILKRSLRRDDQFATEQIVVDRVHARIQQVFDVGKGGTVDLEEAMRDPSIVVLRAELSALASMLHLEFTIGDAGGGEDSAWPRGLARALETLAEQIGRDIAQGMIEELRTFYMSAAMRQIEITRLLGGSWRDCEDGNLVRRRSVGDGAGEGVWAGLRWGSFARTADGAVWFVPFAEGRACDELDRMIAQSRIQVFELYWFGVDRGGAIPLDR